MNPEIDAAEKELELAVKKLARLRKEAAPVEVPDYTFATLTGEVKLSELFAGNSLLFTIHNMGQKCRYCTLWADNLNGLLPHLESRFSVVLLSKDTPEEQQRFANSRGWRYRMASHGGGAYAMERTAVDGESNWPGIACYELRDGKIFLKNKTVFGPGDEFCGMWPILSLAGIADGEWVPQYSYWKKPAQEEMEDGGQDCCC